MRPAGLLVLVLMLPVAAGCGTRSPSRAVTTTPPVARRQPPRHRRTTAVPVLVYHVIGVRSEGAPFEGLYVTPAEFRSQVDQLAREGWHAVTLDAVLAYWSGERTLPPKPVVFTFDDGYPGDWRYALPILRAHRWPGVLNLQIGNLIPLRVRELIRAGWEIDSHTFTHPDLTQVPQARLAREVRASRLWLQRVFGLPVRVFCYPFGRYDATVVREVRRAGYSAAETENQGYASPAQGLLTLDRIRVEQAMDLATALIRARRPA